MFHYDEKKFFHQEMKPECTPPHPRKHYSLPEQVDCTARELRATLERFMQLERTMKDKFDDHMRILTEDNVTFKTVMENAWTDFVSTVRSEINLFETNTDAIVSIFKQAVNARLDEFNEHFAQSFEDYQAHVKTWMDNFENEIRSDVANYEQEMRNIVDGYVTRLDNQDVKINDAIAYMKTNLNVSLENLLYEMQDKDELVGVIDSNIIAYVKRFGAVGDGVTDDTVAIQAAFDKNAPYVVFERGKTYVVKNTILIPSNSTVNFNGATIKGVMTSAETAIFKNANHGKAMFDKNITILNGTINGSGKDNFVGDQGHAFAFYRVNNLVIKNMVIESVCADGIGTRECFNTIIENAKVGAFGRNALSLTSGSYILNNVEAITSPFADANPAAYFNAESNGDGENGAFVINNCHFKNMTFVDFHSPANSEFAYEVKLHNTHVGEGYNTLRFISTNRTKAKGVFVDASNSVVCNEGGSCIYINNVENVVIDGCTLKTNGTSSGYAILGNIHHCKFRNLDLSEWGNLNAIFPYDTFVDSNEFMNVRARIRVIQSLCENTFISCFIKIFGDVEAVNGNTFMGCKVEELADFALNESNTFI